ncbi:hypothetical protein V1951_23515, partial [Yersinia sp. 2544 StPb PI]|uniref:hypothetical protein n=1 Tax=Yersinia sp. 2544 StPb PI TaxID=3117409 RepID=UPI003B28127D
RYIIWSGEIIRIVHRPKKMRLNYLIVVWLYSEVGLSSQIPVGLEVATVRAVLPQQQLVWLYPNEIIFNPDNKLI